MTEIKKKKKRKSKKEQKPQDTKSKSAFDQLSKVQKEFYLLYLKYSNATKAYMQTHPNAEYSTAMTEGHRTLRKPKIQAALKEYYEMLWKSKEDKIGEMFDDLYKASKADIHSVAEIKDGYLQFRNFDEIDTSIIQEVGQSVSQTPSGENTKNSIKLVDKQKARSEMIRVLGMIQEKLKVTFNYDKESAQAIKDVFNESLSSEKADK